MYSNTQRYKLFNKLLYRIGEITHEKTRFPCPCFRPLCRLPVFADNNDNTVKITTTVPGTHTITVTQADGAAVFCNGQPGTAFTVERLSQPQLLVRPDSGRVLTRVLVNGADVTGSVQGGYYTLPPKFTLTVRATTPTVTTLPTVPAVPSQASPPKRQNSLPAARWRTCCKMGANKPYGGRP